MVLATFPLFFVRVPPGKSSKGSTLTPVTMSSSRLPRRVLALIFGLLLIASSCGVSRDGAGGEPAATVTFGDGSSLVVTVGEVEDMAEGLRASPEFLGIVGIPESDLDLVSLDQIIRTAIVTHLLEANGGSVSTADVAVGRDLLDNELLNIFSQTGDEDPAAKASEVAANIDSYIETLATQIGATEKLPEVIQTDAEGLEVPCVRHILLETEADADEVIEDIDGGADFAEVAAEKSTGPSGPSGGELGCASADGYVPEFRDAVLEAEVGQLVGPVQTDFGFHVLEVTAVEEQPADPGVAVEAAIQEVYSEVEVDIDAELGLWDAVTRQVVPPVPE